MSSSALMLSIFFGLVGTGFVMYAKRAGVIVPAVAGVGLMVIPYFLTNLWIMSVICVGLMAMPFVFRDL
jgi:hypothetical protein